MQKSPTARQRSSFLGRTRLQAAFEIGTATESGPLAIGGTAKCFEVRGRVERDAGGRARLMKVASLKLVDAPDDAQQQIEFQFPDETT